MTKTQNSHNAPSTILAHENTQVKASAFEQLKRDFEKAFSAGTYEKELQAISKAVAFSVVKSLYDTGKWLSRRKGEQVNVGCNERMRKCSAEIVNDLELLENTRTAANLATTLKYNKHGDLVQEKVNSTMEEGLADYIDTPLSVSYDIVQHAAMITLKIAKKYSFLGNNWLDREVTIKKLKKQVLKKGETPEYKEVSVVPMVVIYRKVRGYIKQVGALHTDRENSYCYLQEFVEVEDGIFEHEMESVYRRVGKFADIGGYESNIAGGYTDVYTADEQTVLDTDIMIEAMNLTHRQTVILDGILRGDSQQKIADSLGVSKGSIHNHILAVRKKALTFFGEERVTAVLERGERRNKYKKMLDSLKKGESK